MSDFAKDTNVPTNDCISRQAAIDAADRADYTGLAVEDVKKVTDEVVKEIKKLPSEEKRGVWIPCSEKTPMENTEVLVCDKNGFLSIAEYELIDGEKWWRETTECRHIEDAVAWMPLPEPYRPNCGAKMEGEEDGTD